MKQLTSVRLAVIGAALVTLTFGSIETVQAQGTYIDESQISTVISELTESTYGKNIRRFQLHRYPFVLLIR